MRIIGGQCKGHRLFVPRGMRVRPTSDRVRESVFSILGDRVTGARVLDLFAGAGALGLEALSRGAEAAVFVDHHPDSLAAIRRNIQSLGMDASARVVRRDLGRGMGGWKEEAPFDLVFMDPPYGKGLVERALAGIAKAGMVVPKVLVVAEFSTRDNMTPPDGWSLIDQRQYGDTVVAFLEA
jgi:16S rRNA (guanine966-N2)-methyltransferase